MSRRQHLVENNFAYLLGGLLLFFLLIPMLRLGSSLFVDADLLREYLPVGFSLLILIGVWSLQGSRWLFRGGLALALVQIILAVWEQQTHAPFAKIFASFNVMIFCGLSTFLGGKHVFSWRRADTNTLMGAVCVYLLLGLMFALIYAVFLHFWPKQAFNGSGWEGSDLHFDDFLYYSFVTLTSSGYGDITPINPMLRTLAYLEMIIGQFYMAILVAGLVGLFMGKRSGGA